MSRSALALAAVSILAAGCGGTTNHCGPSEGDVAEVIDGDTVVLATGEKVRYLMVDTPETTKEVECYGPEARAFNRSLVLGQHVTLRYDQECTDKYQRLLAYVSVDGTEVNRVLVERGFACVLHIPPNGDDVLEEFNSLETEAKGAARGLWGVCTPKPC